MTLKDMIYKYKVEIQIILNNNNNYYYLLLNYY